MQVTAVNQNGQNFIDTIVSDLSTSVKLFYSYILTKSAGDLWYFPAGIPHSIQATNTDPDGAEFLLVILLDC